MILIRDNCEMKFEYCQKFGMLTFSTIRCTLYFPCLACSLFSSTISICSRATVLLVPNYCLEKIQFCFPNLTVLIQSDQSHACLCLSQEQLMGAAAMRLMFLSWFTQREFPSICFSDVLFINTKTRP